jgi:hypothetical protein
VGRVRLFSTMPPGEFGMKKATSPKMGKTALISYSVIGAVYSSSPSSPSGITSPSLRLPFRASMTF